MAQTQVLKTLEADRDQAPTRDELLQRVTKLLPVIKERAAGTERNRRVSRETAEALVDSKLLRVAVPIKFGGYDVPFEYLFDTVMELGRVCGATSWCSGLWGMHNYWVAYYSPEAQQEMYANGPDVLTASSGFTLDSKATAVSGGFRISGTWKFSSGVDNAEWVFAKTNTADGPAYAMIPRSDFKIIEDSWYVAGMQGTGSKDFVVDDVFVPAHRMRPGLTTPFAMGPTPYEEHPQRRYLVPLGSFLAWDLVAPAIGMAQGAVDEMIARLTGTSGKPHTADSAIVQSRLGQATAEVAAARALLYADIEDSQARVERGEQIGFVDLSRSLRDKAFAMKLSVDAVTRLFEMAGAHALSVDDPMQRFYRDAQACMHREGLVYEFGVVPYGRALLGV